MIMLLTVPHAPRLTIPLARIWYHIGTWQTFSKQRLTPSLTGSRKALTDESYRSIQACFNRSSGISFIESGYPKCRVTQRRNRPDVRSYRCDGAGCTKLPAPTQNEWCGGKCYHTA